IGRQRWRRDGHVHGARVGLDQGLHDGRQGLFEWQGVHGPLLFAQYESRHEPRTSKWTCRGQTLDVPYRLLSALARSAHCTINVGVEQSIPSASTAKPARPVSPTAT